MFLYKGDILSIVFHIKLLLSDTSPRRAKLKLKVKIVLITLAIFTHRKCSAGCSIIWTFDLKHKSKCSNLDLFVSKPNQLITARELVIVGRAN